MADSTNDRRAYNTAYVRRRREARVAAANAHSVVCQAMLGNGHPCKTPLRSRFVDGVTVPWCPTCEKKAKGICIECDQPVVGMRGKALRCALHAKLAKAASLERYRARNTRKMRTKEATRMADPVVHADRLEYKRLYRKSVPGKVAKYKRQYYERHKEKIDAYMAAYRAARREARCERERLRNAGELPPRTCLTCPTVITGRAKRCAPCKHADRTHARAVLTARLESAA